jgi:hypothetical protein
MAVIRIVATDWIAAQVHDAARKEGRTVSAMGQRLLSEALDVRKAATSDVQRIVAALKASPADAKSSS